MKPLGDRAIEAKIAERPDGVAGNDCTNTGGWANARNVKEKYRVDPNAEPMTDTMRGAVKVFGPNGDIAGKQSGGIPIPLLFLAALVLLYLIKR